MTITVNVTDRCVGCGGCLLTCPTHAIRPVGGTLHIVDERCTGCLECLEICPVDAIEERRERTPPTPPAPRDGPADALVVRNSPDNWRLSFERDATSGGGQAEPWRQP